jgi:hypothetical protein
MYRFSSRSLDRLEYVNPTLIAILKDAIKDSPYDFGIPRDGGFRTARGRTTKDLIEKGITGVEGRPDKSRITWTLRSFHMTGNAVDIYAFVEGKPSWDLKYLEPGFKIPRTYCKAFDKSSRKAWSYIELGARPLG